MPNIANVLKDEISRLARKELRNGVEPIAKASSRHRTDIAELKRSVASLERLVAKLMKAQAGGKAMSGAGVDGDANPSFRYSAKSMASQRTRLGLSAAQMGQLLGVSAQTVYKWEEGSVRPRQSQFESIAAVRAMGRREANARLESGGDVVGAAKSQD